MEVLILKKFIHALDEHAEEWVMMALMAVICCVIFLQVIMRYVFKSALPWPEELSRFCFVWMGMLSAGYCVKKGNGIRLDILTSIMPGKLGRATDYLGMIILAFTYGYYFYWSFPLVSAAASSGALSPAMRLPLQFVYAAMAVGFGMGTLRSLQHIFQMAKADLKKGKEAA